MCYCSGETVYENTKFRISYIEITVSVEFRLFASDRSAFSFGTPQRCWRRRGPSPGAFSSCSIFSPSQPHPAAAPGALGGDTGTHGRGWLVSGREAVSSPRLQPFSSASGALYTGCSPSRVSEQTMPIIYFIYVFNTLYYGRCFVASDPVFLCYVFLLKLAAPAAGGFPCWYLLKVEVY